MVEAFSRTARLLGKEAVGRLAACRVAVFGVGGVGGAVVEALARGGVGQLDIIDHDTVCPSNLNRQFIATAQTLGQLKAEAARERILSINPACRVTAHAVRFLPETADSFDFSLYDYVVDAIDTVSGKIELVLRAQAAGVPIISAMGAGNKLDPTAFRVADIYQTSVCPLARVMRTELRRRGVPRLTVVYSREVPLVPRPEADAPTAERACSAGRACPADECPDAAEGSGEPARCRAVPGSVSFVPPVVGMIIAGEVLRILAGLGTLAERPARPHNRGNG
ncbi:MAG: tRNA threonylcarbamoyladenosine dehydratase [Eubacteriales bacterium]